MASGDREGNIRIHSLADFKQVFSTEAHDSDVLSIDFSARFDEATKSSVPWMMASAGRDRFVHVYDARAGFSHTQTFDDHSAAVISTNFSRDNSFLMTSSADRTIRFREYKKDTNTFENIGSAVSRNAIYDVAVSQHSESLVAVGQEKKLNVYDFTGRQLPRYHPSLSFFLLLFLASKSKKQTIVSNIATGLKWSRAETGCSQRCVRIPGRATLL